MPVYPKFGCVVLNKKNLATAAENLKNGAGDILIAEPHYFGFPDHLLNGEFELQLYGSPSIGLENTSVMSGREGKEVGGKIQNVGGLNDRRYRLYPTPPPGGDPKLNSLLAWFDHHDVGGKYLLDIMRQPAPRHYLLQARTLCLYVPPNVPLKPALTFAFKWMINLWSRQRSDGHKGFSFSLKQIDAMVQYVVEDLRTGEVLRHNIQAGQDADAMTSLPLKSS